MVYPFTVQDSGNNLFQIRMTVMDITIPDYLDRDALLQFCVYKVKEVLGGECSIFLKAPNVNKYILQESTILSESIGIETIDIEEKKKQVMEQGIKNIGLTFSVLAEDRCLNIPDVRKDIRWSGYQQGKNYISKSHCETASDRLRSFIADSLQIDNRCLGIIRVVSEKVNFFAPEKENYLTTFAEQLSERIDNAVSFSELIATGAILSKEYLCQRMVEDITRITRAQGCTIFMIDEERLPGNIINYFAIASTGLYDTQRVLYNKEKGNLREVFYKVDYSSPVSHSLTEFAIKQKKQISIDNIYSSEELKKYQTLQREPGHGMYYSEYEYQSSITMELPMTGSALYSPLFDRDKKQVIGLIRINKQRQAGSFSPYEKRLFMSYVEKLTSILKNITFFKTIDQIYTYSNNDDLYRFAVEAASSIVGGSGCSILILNQVQGLLEFKASYGTLENQIECLQPYTVGQGYTGWVAKHRIPLMYNSEKELIEKYSFDLPVHSGRFDECETGG